MIDKYRSDFDNKLSGKKLFSSDIKTNTIQLDDDRYKEARSLYEKCKDSKSYSEYKGAFKKFCKLLQITINKALVIKSVLFSDKNNKVSVKYSNRLESIIIPNGIELTHQSKNPNILELKPTFKSKTGYLYATPRLYFSTKKKMNKLAADEKLDTKMYRYVPNETIRTCYADPLLSGKVLAGINGAIFVLTEFPIKVKKVNDDRKK